MSRNRHSFVQFYMSDWLAGTARMPRIARSVYFDVCCYIWDKVRPVPKSEIAMMLADLGDPGPTILETLIETGQLVRNDDGSINSPRAMAEAMKALEAWEAKSRGGRAKSAGRVLEDTSQDSSTEPEPEPEPQVKERVPNGTPKKTGTRLPDPFEFPDSWKEWAVDEGMSGTDTLHEAGQFTRYWQAKSGKDATKLDWFKTWQNWIARKLKEAGNEKRSNNEHPLGRTGAALDTVLADFARADR